MISIFSFVMYPLQALQDFQIGGSQENPLSVIIFLIIVAVIIFVLVLANSGKKGSFSSGPFAGILSRMHLRRMVRNIGLNNEQIKMLDFVFKTDQAADPEKSINTPSILDRHFRRAYRVIEQNSTSDAELQQKHAVLFSTRNLLESRVSGNLTSTKHLKDDTTVILNTGKEKFNVAVISALGEHLAVEAPENALGSGIKFPRSSKLNVVIFTKNNKGFTFETRVIGYSSVHGRSALLLAHTNQLRFLSQRKFRRKQTAIATNLFLVYLEGSGKKQRLVVDKRLISGTVADISVGGCSIKSKAPIQVGAKIKIEFTHGSHNVAALGQVLRTNRVGMVTIVHVKFLRVTRKSMNLINAYVYEYSSNSFD